ncbi:Uu.00g018270.m01.CDS01 [Anthostomella pinea]|uniref:Uu.00g018270.m01.CDS01 n=1 Tax=Anthostomella pinea TaxID=933095 RepID=A0AAI8W099_9PEZI|nr:Uu.00g018270.m01.CDS01 [Anthostomella pinea]
MKFTVAILALALQVAAEQHIVARNASVISGLLSSTLTSLTIADTQVKAYPGTHGLRGANTNLYKTIKKNTKTAKAMPELTFEDAKAIGALSRRVSAAGDSYIKDLGAAAPHFAAAGVCTYLEHYTINLSAAFGEFFTAIDAKFPAGVQVAAQGHFAELSALFLGAEKALAPPNCVNQIEPPRMHGNHSGHGGHGAGHKPAPVVTAGASGMAGLISELSPVAALAAVVAAFFWSLE